MSFNKKQTTLFQTWGYEGNSPCASSQRSQNSVPKKVEDAFANDDFDEALLAQIDESEIKANSSSTTRNDPSNFEELPPVPQTQALENLPGFDNEAGRTWIYPTNYPVRQYQFNIVKSCLFDNTLVSLPTGLGKTFIAAVVMYNYFRFVHSILCLTPLQPNMLSFQVVSAGQSSFHGTN